MSQDDFKLSLTITHKDGSYTRWGPDEADPVDIPGDTTFSTSMPGGFGDLQTSLFRRIDTDYPDQNILDTVTVLGPGNEVAWEGRMAQFPRTHGDTFSVTPGAEGWVAHLRDDETFSMIYVDRDLAGWGSMSNARNIALLSAAFTQVQGPETQQDTTTGNPTVRTGWAGKWTATPISEAWYDAGPGNLIGSIYYDWVRPNTTSVDNTNTNWLWEVFACSDDIATTTSGSGNLRAATSTPAYLTPATAYRYALLQLAYTASGAGGTDGVVYGIDWRKVTVYGNHGLTVQGTDPGGFYGGAVIAHALSQTCPLLTYSTGTGGSIEDGDFVIPHLTFRDQVMCEDVVRKVTDYDPHDWGVYENREFFWRTPNPDLVCWQARLDQGAKPSFDGPAGQTLLNGVFVTYQDEAGITHTVGPPGSSAEVTDSTLADPSTSNPATALGIRKWQKLDFGEVTTSGGAIAIGAAWLADKLSPQRRGSISLTGMVTHPTKGPRPAWAVRAGDYLQLTDSGNSAQRRILETRYTHSTRTVDCTLDNTSPDVAALMQRFGVVLTGVI